MTITARAEVIYLGPPPCDARVAGGGGGEGRAAAGLPPAAGLARAVRHRAAAAGDNRGLCPEIPSVSLVTAVTTRRKMELFLLGGNKSSG